MPAHERARIAAEGGLVAMTHSRDQLDEAAAALRDAMRGGSDETALVGALGLALALERRGASQAARAVVADRVHGDPRALLADPGTSGLLAVAPAERWALVAVGLQTAHPAEARALWRQYVTEAPESPWVAEARLHAGVAASGSAGSTP
jgi:hypothetical protein